MSVRCSRCNGRVVSSREYVQGQCSFVLVEVCQICGNRSYGEAGAPDLEKWSPDFPAKVNQRDERKVMGMAKKPKRECASCKRVMAIVGRGLCGSCLKKHTDNGTLDELFPARWQRQPKPAVDSPSLPPKSIPLDRPNIEPEEFGAAAADPVRPVAENGGGKVLSMPQKTIVAPRRVLDVESCIMVEMSARDAELLRKLAAWADDERRSVPDQILHILDRVVDDRLAGLS